ncbi:hypothetical protein FRC08_015114 [Ceratobasidium sp. 394]|nr:hypothetical protein FRC08_015114 [Ceratobasidium sp. 394]
MVLAELGRQSGYPLRLGVGVCRMTSRIAACARLPRLQHVFGLQTVFRNIDTNNWKIGQGQTLTAANSALTKAYHGPKSPAFSNMDSSRRQSKFSWRLLDQANWLVDQK